ncbi:MAG: patatin-like phospholipase family protein [Spirochaetia bacterium]|nr:patatin-like phospholipase family protein [Spirochaetia bacterium]
MGIFDKLFSKHKIGLVFSGGGGRGSYGLGVWKYLEEIGLTKKISVLSGTSVGGLNAVLLSLCGFEVAKKVWTTRVEDNILDFISFENRNWALFSRTGLIEIMEEYVDFHKFSSHMRKIYVACYNKDYEEVEYFCLNKQKIDIIKQLLCATSALPGIFQVENIFGHNYYDGAWFGKGDNMPIKPLCDEGCTDALVINLDRKNHKDFSNSGMNIIMILPSEDLGGNPVGLLDFSPEGAKRRMQLGYYDCKNRYAPLLKTLCSGLKYSQEETLAREINAMDDKAVLQRTIEIVSNNPDYLEKIQAEFNIDPPTLGGKVFWHNIVEYNGWCFQQNDFLDDVFDKQIVRLLDSEDYCRANGSRRQMVDICRSFLLSRLNP